MIDTTIQQFVQKAIDRGYISDMDKIVITNQLLHILRKDSLAFQVVDSEVTFDDLIADFLTYAVSHQIIEDTLVQRDQLSAHIMSLITPLPSHLNQMFWSIYQDSPIEATNYFYQLSQDNHYIKTKDIAKNRLFHYKGKYGTLDITINLSKPEKDPKDISKALTTKRAGYPESLLTTTNEGYYGREDFPARSQHRLIRLQLSNEQWAFQYSPYAYFNEHSIFLSEVVRPMSVDEKCLKNLMRIVTLFPHYFVGSNAGLPIVGGSILSHDHYQAGRHVFPMERAETRFEFSVKGVKASVLNWPLSVIRLREQSSKKLLEAATELLKKWEHYSDESVGVLSHTEVQHNAITPIARFKEGYYEMDMVLRNNRTTLEYPDGIFHPHADVQHIKKENIGLIEVMGLAILPPRLKRESDAVARYLLDDTYPIEPMHKAWASTLKRCQSLDEAKNEVERGIGQVFERVLEDAGVFKTTPEGIAAFKRFIDELGDHHETIY